MDNNKTQKLQDIGYEIKPSCGTCIHFRQHEDANFGVCDKYTYVHLKHSGGSRKLSVVQYGSCDAHELGDVDYLHGFKEFLTSSDG